MFVQEVPRPLLHYIGECSHKLLELPFYSNFPGMSALFVLFNTCSVTKKALPYHRGAFNISLIKGYLEEINNLKFIDLFLIKAETKMTGEEPQTAPGGVRL